MTLCSTGSISLGGSTTGRSVNVESRRGATQTISMGETNIRDLADKPTGAVSLFDFRGKSWEPTSFGQCKVRWGGIYMMQTSSANFCQYYLFVAPNASGCVSSCRWKTTDNTTAGTFSASDGYNNTYTYLNNTAHPSGNWCATRTINGFSDWYLPGQGELGSIFNNGGANACGETVMGSGEGYRGTGYWSSAHGGFNSAWAFTFYQGYAYVNFKRSQAPITRAVRREPI